MSGKGSIRNLYACGNAPPPGRMERTVLPATHCWRQWCLPTVVTLTAQNNKCPGYPLPPVEKMPRLGMQKELQNQGRWSHTQSLKELQQVMSDYVGIVRNDVRLRGYARAWPLWEKRNNYMHHFISAAAWTEKYDRSGYLDCKKGFPSGKRAADCITIPIILQRAGWFRTSCRSGYLLPFMYYAVVYGFCGWSPPPLRVLYFFGDRIYGLVFYIGKYRRDVAMSNIRHAFLKNDKEVRQIAKQFYHNSLTRLLRFIKRFLQGKKFISKKYRWVWSDKQVAGRR